MKERTLLPVAVVGLLLLWVGTLALWTVEAQMTDDDAGPRVSVEVRPVSNGSW